MKSNHSLQSHAWQGSWWCHPQNKPRPGSEGIIPSSQWWPPLIARGCCDLSDILSSRPQTRYEGTPKRAAGASKTHCGFLKLAVGTLWCTLWGLSKHVTGIPINRWRLSKGVAKEQKLQEIAREGGGRRKINIFSPAWNAFWGPSRNSWSWGPRKLRGG